MGGKPMVIPNIVGTIAAILAMTFLWAIILVYAP
jgi:hypothetical protein